MPAIWIFLFFCLLAVVLIATAVGLNYLETQRKKQVKSMFRSVDGAVDEEAPAKILVDQTETDSTIRRVAVGLGLWDKFEATILQSGLNWPVTQVLTASAVAALIGYLIGWKLNVLLLPFLSGLPTAVLGACLPYMYVLWKRRQRFAEFEEQFPEALDFLARSMRAGHAFSISLEMLGAESPEPLGLEFRTLFNELNLGSPLEVAFGNMMRRLPLVDVRFFVSSVMLQRQTGGNLSEILVRLSYVIRERFRLKGQVKAASAHGRMTAGILTAMPIVLMVALLFVAPGYLQGMARDPDGKYLIIAAIVAQGLGYFFIRRIINIKV